MVWQDKLSRMVDIFFSCPDASKTNLSLTLPVQPSLIPNRNGHIVPWQELESAPLAPIWAKTRALRVMRMRQNCSGRWYHRTSCMSWYSILTFMVNPRCRYFQTMVFGKAVNTLMLIWSDQIRAVSDGKIFHRQVALHPVKSSSSFFRPGPIHGSDKNTLKTTVNSTVDERVGSTAAPIAQW